MQHGDEAVNDEMKSLDIEGLEVFAERDHEPQLHAIGLQGVADL